ncbi:MAG: PAS domain S-box protein [Cyanobacteria bacterium SBLK]|nr:PAS domain S-box protein [Cyanobacteria bacterium SBLK]
MLAFIPHGHCYLWQTNLVRLHIFSDSLIALAYAAIPIILVYLVNKREDIPFNWVFFMFGAFILSCGTTHVMGVWTLWHPNYWLSGAIKAVTAIVSVTTAIALIPLIPKVLAIPSAAQLEEANRQLAEQIDRKMEIEQSLQKEREFLKALLENLSDGIVACNENGILTLFNRATREFHGLPSQTLPPEQWAEYFDLYQADGKTLMSTDEIPLFRAFQGEKLRDAEMVIAPKQGEMRAILASGQPICDSRGEKLGAVVAMHDISDRKQAEKALKQANQELESRVEKRTRELKESQERYQKLVDNIPGMIFQYRFDPDGSHDFVYASTRSRDIFEVEPDRLDGLSMAHPDELEGLQAKMLESAQTLNRFNWEGRIVTSSQKIKWIQAISHTKRLPDNATLWEGVILDISDRKEAELKLEQQTRDLENTLRELQRAQGRLIQSEKMSALGQLVAGVAHEINNPVNFIHGNLTPVEDYVRDVLVALDLYRQHCTDLDPESVEQLEELEVDFLQEDLPKVVNSMKEGARRIREIVLSLRTFSRLDEAEFKDADIHEGIDSTLTILQHRLKKTPDSPAIQIVKNYDRLPRIDCYAGQLNQVFMNILSNAIDAIEERNKQRTREERQTNPGTISIMTELDRAESLVNIRIRDNGMGIPKDTNNRIFDPFFTTKAIGKGTGLGMSISYQIIVEKHGGHLSYTSSLGEGTEFIIELPLSKNKS